MSILDRLRPRRAPAPQVDVEPVAFPAWPAEYPEDVFDVPVLVVVFLPATGGRTRPARLAHWAGMVSRRPPALFRLPFDERLPQGHRTGGARHKRIDPQFELRRGAAARMVIGHGLTP
jgi:hypothetical protein